MDTQMEDYMVLPSLGTQEDSFRWGLASSSFFEVQSFSSMEDYFPTTSHSRQ